MNYHQKTNRIKGTRIVSNMEQTWIYYKSKLVFKLTRLYVKRFLRELVDVWEYRAQIDNETKEKLIPTW